MAWVHVGPHKINTALVCYVELEGDTVRLYFHGEWEGNPLDLHFDEAKAFWRHLKAEDVTTARDKGSAMVLPKLGSAGSSYSVGEGQEKKEAPKPSSSSTSHSSSSHSHSDSHKHGEHKKH